MDVKLCIGFIKSDPIMEFAPIISSYTRHYLTVIFAGLCIGVNPVFADPPHGKGNGKGRVVGEQNYGGGGISVTVSFEQARRIAVDVGARGYKPLPPGIRRNLARGKPLPPGIVKKMAPAPMVARLPVYAGHEWRIVGSDLVLVAIATSVVVEVLMDVFN